MRQLRKPDLRSVEKLFAWFRRFVAETGQRTRIRNSAMLLLCPDLAGNLGAFLENHVKVEFKITFANGKQADCAEFQMINRSAMLSKALQREQANER